MKAETYAQFYARRKAEWLASLRESPGPHRLDRDLILALRTQVAQEWEADLHDRLLRREVLPAAVLRSVKRHFRPYDYERVRARSEFNRQAFQGGAPAP